MPGSLSLLGSIARSLGASVNSVNTHIRSIYSKLGASDRSSAVQQERAMRPPACRRALPVTAEMKSVVGGDKSSESGDDRSLGHVRSSGGHTARLAVHDPDTGRLGATALSAFPTMRSELQDGESVLTGALDDRSAVYGVLTQMEALGLEILEFRR